MTTTDSGSPPRSWLAPALVVAWLVAAGSATQIGIWLAMGGAAVLLGIGVMVLDRRDSLALLRRRLRWALLGAGAGAGMAVATYVLYPWLSRELPFLATDTARLYAEFRAPSRQVAGLLLFPIILGEELVWRGAIQSALARRCGPSLGPWVSSILAAVLYALAHGPIGSPVLIAVALGCGLAWSALRAATNSLVPSVVAHLLWDVLVLLWFPVDTLSR